MSGLHATLANTIVLYLALVGLWGLWLGIRALGPTASFRGALVIAELAAVAQGVVGLVLALPLAATLVRDRAPRGQSVALGIAALFTAGLAIRGITTGGG